MKLKEFLTQKINKDTLKKDSVKRAIKITICCAFILSLIFLLVCCSFGSLVIHAYSNPLAEDVQLVYVDELPTTDIDDNTIYVISGTDDNVLLAGTYRFNDILTRYYSDTKVPLDFTVSGHYDGVDILLNCNLFDISGYNETYEYLIIYWTVESSVPNIVSSGTFNCVYDDGLSANPRGWIDYFGDGIKTITLATDQSVVDIFHTWFIANTNYNQVNSYISSSTTYHVHYNNTWFETDNISTAVTFINYRITNPSLVNTLPELLDSYTGTWEDFRAMLDQAEINGNPTLNEGLIAELNEYREVGETTVKRELNSKTTFQQFIDQLTEYDMTNAIDVLNNHVRNVFNDGLDIGYAQGLEVGDEQGYNRGTSENFGQNLLGDTFNAPLNALNQWVLFETPGGIEVTMGGLFTAVIALAVLVIFLKMFAGG